MNQKNLNALNKIHKNLLNYLKDKKINQIYKQFEHTVDRSDNFIVAVSGGPDSLALAFFSKIYSIKHNLESKFFIIDHGLRKESQQEAKIVVKKLSEKLINLQILKWNGKKPKKNIQAIARNKRYSLLFEQCRKYKINNMLLGHHYDDLIENFLIRFTRGSGLNGLVSFSKETRLNGINLLRPLINISKNDLIYTSKKIFKFYVNDPSNKKEIYKRTRIRNLIESFEKEGLDKNKFLLTINNLQISNSSIKFYVEKNLIENTFFSTKHRQVILNSNFFKQSEEVIFRSFSMALNLVNRKYYPARGKKLKYVIDRISKKDEVKLTLGGCVIQKINQTVFIIKE